MTNMETYKLVKETIKKTLEAAQKAAALAFNEEAQTLFKDHPEMESFSWTQYTPFFNDGDECVFSAHYDYPEINGIDFDELETFDYETKKYKASCEDHDPDGKLFAAGEAVKEFLSEFDDDILKAMFGDHCRVTITPNGAETDDYDHE